jgi:hypothetical protein
MKKWRKGDIGKRIIYEGGEVIIYDANSNVPNTIKFAEYPILFEHQNDKEMPIKVNSEIGLAYVVKSQKKKSIEDVQKPGDWYFVQKVSKDERKGILAYLANSPKITRANEDVSPKSVFN